MKLRRAAIYIQLAGISLVASGQCVGVRAHVGRAQLRLLPFVLRLQLCAPNSQLGITQTSVQFAVVQVAFKALFQL